MGRNPGVVIVITKSRPIFRTSFLPAPEILAPTGSSIPGVKNKWDPDWGGGGGVGRYKAMFRSSCNISFEEGAGMYILLICD